MLGGQDGQYRLSIVVTMVIGKVKVGWDVTCVLRSKAKEGQLVTTEVGAQVLCRFQEVAAL